MVIRISSIRTTPKMISKVEKQKGPGTSNVDEEIIQHLSKG